jgi:integrase
VPRRAKGPRLYLDPGRKQWVIRDGTHFVRTGSPEPDRTAAEKSLAEYIGQKHKPEPGQNPLIADMLIAYGNEHVPHTKSAKNVSYNIGNIGKWWSDKRLNDVTAKNCRAYAASKRTGGARRDLETLRAAIGYWHREHGPLPTIPAVVLPKKSEPRDRWLTRSEAARLLWAARHTPHLARFIIIGLYTGSRSGAIRAAKWSWVDFSASTMRRRAPGEAEDRRKRTPLVRLSPRLLAHLRRWYRLDKERKTLPIVHYNGQAVKKLRRSWDSAVNRAGLEDVTPHTLRHTKATWLMQDKVDFWQAAGFLGMTVEMLQRVYGHHHPDWQKEAARV